VVSLELRPDELSWQLLLNNIFSEADPRAFSFRLACSAEEETQAADDDALTENEETLGETSRTSRNNIAAFKLAAEVWPLCPR
jgi:hypothetical protein